MKSRVVTCRIEVGQQLFAPCFVSNAFLFTRAAQYNFRRLLLRLRSCANYKKSRTKRFDAASWSLWVMKIMMTHFTSATLWFGFCIHGTADVIRDAADAAAPCSCRLPSSCESAVIDRCFCCLRKVKPAKKTSTLITSHKSFQFAVSQAKSQYHHGTFQS